MARAIRCRSSCSPLLDLSLSDNEQKHSVRDDRRGTHREGPGRRDGMLAFQVNRCVIKIVYN